LCIALATGYVVSTYDMYVTYFFLRDFIHIQHSLNDMYTHLSYCGPTPFSRVLSSYCTRYMTCCTYLSCVWPTLFSRILSVYHTH
jgi:hypothetical protein